MASRSRSAARLVGFGACAAFALTPFAAQAGATDSYYERALMSAANARCHLFEPNLAAALAMTQAQARGAALRSGVEEDELDQVAERARAKAGGQPCDSADLATAAEKVKTGFVSFARLTRLDYPGELKTWAAVRQDSTTGRIWNLSQSAGFGADSLTFGITQYKGVKELIAVAQFADGADPYAARIIMRDRSLSRRAYLDSRVTSDGKIPLSGRVTPRSATKSYLADTEFSPGPLLKPAGKTPALAYRFPATAAAALSDLDPREAIQIEFQFSNGTVRTAYIEVGDFAAGRAFLMVAQR